MTLFLLKQHVVTWIKYWIVRGFNHQLYDEIINVYVNFKGLIRLIIGHLFGLETVKKLMLKFIFWLGLNRCWDICLCFYNKKATAVYVA